MSELNDFSDSVKDLNSGNVRKRKNVEQNNFVTKYILSRKKKQNKPRNKDNSRARSVKKYFIRQTNGHILSVCNATFLSITKLSRKAVNL